VFSIFPDFSDPLLRLLGLETTARFMQAAQLCHGITGVEVWVSLRPLHRPAHDLRLRYLPACGQYLESTSCQLIERK